MKLSENQSSVQVDRVQTELVSLSFDYGDNDYSWLSLIAENAIFDAGRPQSSAAPKQTFHPDQPGLQCYSCGSLLNPNKKCDQFSRTDKSQVQTCLKDEACLMYTWKKSPTETATLRECFPTRVLLGTIRDPLVPLPDCSQKDITDDSSGSDCSTRFFFYRFEG